MPNVNNPFGLRPLRSLSGGSIVQNTYTIAATYATAIYTGDVVKMTGTGKNIAKSAAGDTANVGVFMGCSWVTAQGQPQWSPCWPGVSDGKTNIEVLVIDDPNVIFECQADGCAEADVGIVCDWNVGTGSLVTGKSGLYAVASGIVTTTGGSLKVMGLSNRPGNEYGAYAKIEVLIVEHVNNAVVAGAGGV